MKEQKCCINVTRLIIESEAGIIYNDSELNIDWQIPIEKAIVSEKDKTFRHWLNAIIILNLKPDVRIAKILVTGSNGQLGKRT